MSEPFVGQLKLVGFLFAPKGWADANGQILAISQNTALFSLYGTTYGGDGKTTFALPDLRGRTPIHVGGGPGLPTYVQGERGGETSVALIASNLPAHNHTASGTTHATSNPAEAFDPGGNILAQDAGTGIATYIDQAPDQPMRSGDVEVTRGNSGGNLPHDNMMPYLTLRYVVSLFGTYPSRN